MALAGNMGADLLSVPDNIPPLAWWFGEDQSRYLVTLDDGKDLITAAKARDVPALLIGRTGGLTLTLADGDFIPLSKLQNAHENWFPEYMAAS